MHTRLLPSIVLAFAAVTLCPRGAVAEGADERILPAIADPAFYVYPHRRAAVADGLALYDAVLAATGAYSDVDRVRHLWDGVQADSLRKLAQNGGRAGMAANAILQEAEKSLFGQAASQRH